MFFGIPHKPMSCDMRTLLSCLHHAPNTPSFALFCSYRSHQQRSKRALQTVVRILMDQRHPPPYVGTSVNIRPLPIFFEIFLFVFFVVIFYI